MTQTEITAERIYLEAVHAAGVADDVLAWRSKVDALAAEISNGLESFTKNKNAVARTITLEGIVMEAIENVVSEGNKVLDLYKVIFKADVGGRADAMWVDKRTAAGAALFAQALALVGKRARIVKETRNQFNGNEIAADGEGKPITRPYLASIQPIGSEGSGPAPTESTTPTPENNPEAAPAPESAANAKQSELFNISPTSAKQVVELAKEHFEMTDQQVKTAVENVIGPRQTGANRTKADLKKAWSAIVYAQTGTDVTQ